MGTQWLQLKAVPVLWYVCREQLYQWATPLTIVRGTSPYAIGVVLGTLKVNRKVFGHLGILCLSELLCVQGPLRSRGVQQRLNRCLNLVKPIIPTKPICDCSSQCPSRRFASLDLRDVVYFYIPPKALRRRLIFRVHASRPGKPVACVIYWCEIFTFFS